MSKKNPFETMAEIYENQVKEVDTKNNTAGLFLKATEYFIDQIEDCSNEYYNAHSLCDIEYLDGYFIFGHGTNSVIHFHVKECPDWKFGIWWSKEENKSRKKDKDIFINGEFFCQYEPTMDKFKPSRSSYNQTFKLKFNSNEELDTEYTDYIIFFDVSRVLDYIQKNPIMAWGHDYCGIDYNTKYVSKFTVCCKYMSYKFKEFKKNLIIPILNNNLVKYTEELFLDENKRDIEDLGWKVKVQDRGEDISPRYELTVELPDGFNREYQDTGCYNMFREESINQIRWDKRHNLLESISDFFRVYWFRPIDDFVVFWNQKDLDESWSDNENNIEENDI